jgi:hypothetical protein
LDSIRSWRTVDGDGEEGRKGWWIGILEGGWVGLALGKGFVGPCGSSLFGKLLRCAPQSAEALELVGSSGLIRSFPFPLL